jgi:hypothetical protein
VTYYIWSNGYDWLRRDPKSGTWDVGIDQKALADTMRYFKGFFDQGAAPRSLIAITSGSSEEIMSMAIPSDGSYGIEAGVIYSHPVTVANGEYRIVRDLSIDEFSRKRMDATHTELREERDGVKHLLG